MAKKILKKPKGKSKVKGKNKSFLIVKPKNLIEQQKDLVLDLPTEKSTPIETIEEINILIYGAIGIGKTSLASKFASAFNLMFESGGKGLAIYQRPCPSWMHFRKYLDLLETTKHNYKTIVIDTASIAYEKCFAYVMEAMNLKHPSDEKWGGGWVGIRTEHAKQLGRCMLNDLGLIALAHEKVETTETKSGLTYEKIVPHLTGQAAEYYAAPIDVVARYYYEKNERWLIIRGNEHIEAKCRLENNFLTPDGEPVYKIPMGSSSDEAYLNFKAAFNNEQDETYAPDSATKTKVKTKVKTKFKSKKKVKQTY